MSKYIYSVDNNGNAKLIANIDEQNQSLHVQDNYPAQEYMDGYTSFLAYNEEQGVHWEFKKRPASELREQAYRTQKIITYGNEILTVDEANKLWLEYQAEGSSKSFEISILISNAKSSIRARYPDIIENEIEEDEFTDNEFIGGDSEVEEEQFSDEILDDEEDPLLNVEIVGEDAEEDFDDIGDLDSMGDID